MENYEKKYKDLVEAIKTLKEANPSDEGIQNWVKDNVPELQESEDERIRKWIIENIQETLDVNGFFEGQKTIAKNAIVWLKKQGEQKPYGQREECSDCQFNYAGECKGSCAMKRDEQNPVDKVEPKFNIGDIIFNKKTK